MNRGKKKNLFKIRKKFVVDFKQVRENFLWCYVRYFPCLSSYYSGLKHNKDYSI